MYQVINLLQKNKTRFPRTKNECVETSNKCQQAMSLRKLNRQKRFVNGVEDKRKPLESISFALIR